MVRNALFAAFLLSLAACKEVSPVEVADPGDGVTVNNHSGEAVEAAVWRDATGDVIAKSEVDIFDGDVFTFEIPVGGVELTVLSADSEWLIPGAEPGAWIIWPSSEWEDVGS